MTEKKEYKPIVFVIMDGFGIAPSAPGNAIRIAKMPVWNGLWRRYPHTMLTAHGSAVGLFPEADGNSEAGHMNIGAGRIVKQDLVSVSDMIDDGTFFKNPAFLHAIKTVKKNKSNLHLMGLVTGYNSAHAHPDHLRALIKMARQEGVKNVYLHLFTDGRDSAPYGGYDFLHELMDYIEDEKIATIMGRFYGMDRKKEWSRTEIAYDALTNEGSVKKVDDPLVAIESSYADGITDEFIKPFVVEGGARIEDGDSVVFFNARSDRARQLTKAFVQTNFNGENPGSFVREKTVSNLTFVAMTDFGPDLPGIMTAYPSPDLRHTLTMELEDLRQLYIAETDKYGHMTYFFNGGYAKPVAGEKRMLVPSPNVDSYDDTPEMSAGKITDVVIDSIEKRDYDFVAINFANPDMIGHTGNLTATIKGLEFVDKCLKRIYNLVVQKTGGTMIITSDHGNSEEMISEDGGLDTDHSKSPVPFVIISPDDDKYRNVKLKPKGILGDIAPTILDLFEKDKPKDMTGESLLLK